MKKNNQLKLFKEEPSPETYAERAQFSKLEKDLQKAISNRNPEEIYHLSNELGITYNDNDPLAELYQEGQRWVEHEREKEVMKEWDKLQYIKTQTKKVLDNSRSYNNSQINDISHFVERNHPLFTSQKKSIQNFSENEVYGMFKKLQNKYEKQYKTLENTSKEFFQKNEDILKKYVIP